MSVTNKLTAMFS